MQTDSTKEHNPTSHVPIDDVTSGRRKICDINTLNQTNMNSIDYNDNTKKSGKRQRRKQKNADIQTTNKKCLLQSEVTQVQYHDPISTRLRKH